MNYLVISLLLWFGGVKSQTYGDNTVCPSVSSVEHPKITSFGTTHRLEFTGPVLVQKLLIDTQGCGEERQLIEGGISVEFIDASDATYQMRIHADDLRGTWDHTEDIIEVPLGGVLYTELLVLNTISPILCSTVSIQGCTTSDICHPDTCKNGGTCIGNGNCACAKGFMGDDCSSSVADMTVDDYDIVAAAAGLLFTTDAAFDVTGDVAFTIDGRHVKRSNHHHHHHNSHGNCAHFHGHGGSCHYSHSHSAGYSQSHHSTYGHHSSHSATSSMNGANSYSHTCQHSYGHGHNHNSQHYLYTTHGSNHYSHGASLYCHNNQLHMHVHDHHHNQHHHVTCPYNPQPGQTNHIVTSYSPQSGASITINGQTKSTPGPATASPRPPPTQSSTTATGLCFGLCGTVNVNLPINSTLSNIAVAGASLPTLTQNSLLGILGNKIVDFLLHQLLPNWNQMSSTKPISTPKPPPLPVFTKAPPTTVKAQFPVFTKAPPTTVKAQFPVFTKAPSTTVKKPTMKPTFNFPVFTNAPSTTVKAFPVFTLAPTTLPPVTATSSRTLPPITATSPRTLPPITATSPHHVQGIICHDCLRLNKDGNCTSAMQCTNGDVCLAMHDRYGYTHRCISKQDCDHGTLKATADCWYCCDTYLCNDRCNAGNASSCQDDPQCASLRNLGAFYDVCSDPALSTTTCKKTCNNCP